MTFLEWLASATTSPAQHINTGLKSTDFDEIIIDFELLATPGSWGCLFGMQGNYSSGAESFIATWNNSRFNFRCGGGGNQIAALNTTALNTRYKYRCYHNGATAYYYIDDTLQGSATKGTITTTLNCYLFSNNTSYGGTQYVGAKIYNAKFYKNSVLVADFVPAKNDNNQVGMYDNVSGNFYTNQGSGSFTAGPEIAPNTYTVSFDSNGGAGTMEDQTIYIDEATPLDTCAFVRAGYSFLGWATSATGSVVYTDGETVENLAEADDTITLYAVWQKLPLQFILQTNNSENNKAVKDLTNVLTLTGTLKDDTSITDPVLIIAQRLDDVALCNYCTVPMFNRSYFITDIKSVRRGVTEITLHVDVLSSFINQLKECTGIIKRNEKKWNLYLNDGVFKVYQPTDFATADFPTGFSTFEYILTVAGQ